jgi:hypothetical protein
MRRSTVLSLPLQLVFPALSNITIVQRIKLKIADGGRLSSKILFEVKLGYVAQ